MPVSKLLTKPTILFVSLNVLRLLSVVAICLVFSGEIYIMVEDIRGYRSPTSSSASSTPATTAWTVIARRSLLFNLDGEVIAAGADSAPSPAAYFAASSSSTSVPTGFASSSATAAPTTAKGFHRVRRHELQKREPISTTVLDEDEDAVTTTYTTSKRRPASTISNSASQPFSTALPTATNTASSSFARASAEGRESCAYVGGTSIPKTAGGVVFSTLERISCAMILLLSLVSELPLPSKLYLPATRFWASTFPSFGPHHGVGVLGLIQVFLGCVVLSHAVTGWVQVSAWLLFIVGVLDLLAGLTFGPRLNPLRSLSADSTSPSALRRLRLASTTSKVDYGETPSSSWTRFTKPSTSFDQPHSPSDYGSQQDPHHLEPEPEPEMIAIAGPSFRPARVPSRNESSGSRNGPNGIVISPPRPLRSNLKVEVEEEGEEGGRGVTPPPPIYRVHSRRGGV
ncbi:hypothetical protein JCM11641_004779 [Rhodosporidiobolus odoratus]